MGDVMGSTLVKTLVKVSLMLAAIAAVCVFVSSGRGAEDAVSISSESINGLRWRFIEALRGGRSEAVVGDSQHPLVFLLRPGARRRLEDDERRESTGEETFPIKFL